MLKGGITLQVFTLFRPPPALSVLQQAGNFVQIQQAAAILGRGEVVAFPTETVYGLGGNAFSDEAVSRIFHAKGRPGDNPLIVHIGHPEELRRVVTGWPPVAEELINRFWPGPLTLVLPRRPDVSALVTSGLPTVAVRMPNHPVALQLLRAVGFPLAAPSANRSGRPSPTSAAHVIEDLDGFIAAVIDGGVTPEGVESTVLDLSSQTPAILRPGSITREMLLPYLPGLPSSVRESEIAGVPLAPGMKHPHYMPKAPLYLYIGEREAVQQRINQDAILWQSSTRKVAIILTDPTPEMSFPGDLVLDLSIPSGSTSAPSVHAEERLRTVASNLFAALRFCDQERMGVILVQGVEETGIGEAIMNRLNKAAREAYYVVSRS
ncbi:MAG: L-threonylcarbamoyladenylate synthase [Symbiobacteriaceae bacterium]|nr:L-threonylcarbamoyladenylate synthase [Symbiobacteriaceae bacterium]